MAAVLPLLPNAGEWCGLDICNQHSDATGDPAITRRWPGQMELTQDELARVMKTTDQTVANYEKARRLTWGRPIRCCGGKSAAGPASDAYRD
jgi:hypothetical protein